MDCEHKTAPTQQFGVPSVRTTDIANGRIDFDSCNRVSEKTYRQWTRRMEPRPGDLILAREAPVGDVGIIPSNTRACLGQRTVLIRADERTLHSRYLLYLLLTPEMRHELQCRADGSTVSHLNPSDIRSLDIPPLPSLAEQPPIADILGSLDDKIELNRRMNQTLEQMARALFKSWFIDFDPVRYNQQRQAGGQTGPADEIHARFAHLFPARFQDSALGPIPREWRAGTLGEIATNVRRTIKPEQVDPARPYIGVEHMPRRSIALPEWETAEAITSGDWFGFVLGHISSDPFVQYANAGSTGTKMPRANWDYMSRYGVAVPAEAVASAFTELVKPLVERIHGNIHENHRLAMTRDALLPKLLSGELDARQTERLAGVAVQ